MNIDSLQIEDALKLRLTDILNEFESSRFNSSNVSEVEPLVNEENVQNEKKEKKEKKVNFLEKFFFSQY